MKQPTEKIGVNMMIDFTDNELDVIYDALEEMRISIEDDDTLLMIKEITNKMWKASKNDS
jgi:hypothetical protein